MVGKALLGVKDEFGETGVNWDGSIVSLPLYLLGRDKPAGEEHNEVHKGLRPQNSDKFYLAFGYGPSTDSWEPLGADRDATKRVLIDGYLPGVTVKYYSQLQDIEYEETVFTIPVPGAGKKTANIVAMTIRNPGDTAKRTTLVVRFGWKNKKRRSIPTRCIQRGKTVVDADGNRILLSDRKGAFFAGKENTISYSVRLRPKQETTLCFHLPRRSLSAKEAARLAHYDFNTALKDFRKLWSRILSKGMSIRVPERMINNLYRNLIAQCFISADGDIMYYGAYPSGYDNTVFGAEEGWTMLALAYWGHAEDCKRYMTNTYLTPHFLRREQQGHHQMRNGLCARYAYECYRITRDKKWLKKTLPLIKEAGDWTISRRKENMKAAGPRRPLHWGLLPQGIIGGDIGTPGYPIFANACCWRGLRDLGLALKAIGAGRDSAYYLREARDYQRTILHAARKILHGELDPPLLPLHLYERRTRRPPPKWGDYSPMGDYYQLFAPLILEAGIFGYRTRLARILIRYLERTNRLFCGLPRFWGGIDAHYGKGYADNKLMTGKTEEFLSSFYGHLSFSMDADVFTFPEVREFRIRRGNNPLAEPTTTDAAAWVNRRCLLDLSHNSEPCSAGPGVILQYLRNMLVLEERDDEQRVTGKLLLAHGIPRRWLADGQSIEVTNAPTCFGRISYSIRSVVSEGRIEVVVDPPPDGECKGIVLRLRHPDGKRITGILINGRRVRNNGPGGLIDLGRSPKARTRIRVSYRRS